MRLGTYYRTQLFDQIRINATGKRVLDVGGRDGYWLSTQNARDKFVVDLEIIKRHKKITYLKADALRLPFPGSFFDQVFAFDVLEHIEEGKEQCFIGELIRVCKKDGEIILSTPSSKIKIFPPFLTDYVSRKWGHFKGNGYSKQQLANLLSGYNNIKFEILDNNAFNFRMFYFSNRILWMIWPQFAKKILDIIAFFDARSRRGVEGFFFVKILKR